jgi:hypothetical protein
MGFMQRVGCRPDLVIVEHAGGDVGAVVVGIVRAAGAGAGVGIGLLA